MLPYTPKALPSETPAPAEAASDGRTGTMTGTGAISPVTPQEAHVRQLFFM
jgi:hypothetical protein